MKCFNHHQTEAVGICIECNKGSCPECAADTASGIYCKGNCEEPRQDKIRRKGKRALLYAVAGIFYVLLGYPLRGEVIKVGHLFIGAGLGFLFISIHLCYAWIKLKRKRPIL